MLCRARCPPASRACRALPRTRVPTERRRAGRGVGGAQARRAQRAKGCAHEHTKHRQTTPAVHQQITRTLTFELPGQQGPRSTAICFSCITSTWGRRNALPGSSETGYIVAFGWQLLPAIPFPSPAGSHQKGTTQQGARGAGAGARRSPRTCTESHRAGGPRGRGRCAAVCIPAAPTPPPPVPVGPVSPTEERAFPHWGLPGGRAAPSAQQTAANVWWEGRKRRRGADKNMPRTASDGQSTAVCSRATPSPLPLPTESTVKAQLVRSLGPG